MSLTWNYHLFGEKFDHISPRLIQGRAHSVLKFRSQLPVDPAEEQAYIRRESQARKNEKIEQYLECIHLLPPLHDSFGGFYSIAFDVVNTSPPKGTSQLCANDRSLKLEQI